MFRILCAVSLALFAAPSWAQLSWSDVSPPALPTLGPSPHVFDSEADEVEDAPEFRAATLSFTPDPELRARAVEELISRIDARSPQDAAHLEGMDLFGIMAGALAPYDYSVNDLADATAVYMIELYDAANGVTDDTEVATAHALSAQVAQGYAAIAEDEPALSDPAQVQEQSDLFLLQAMMIAMLGDSYGTGPGAEPFREEMARTAQEVFGFDFTQATLGPDGLTIPGVQIAQ